MKKIVTGAVLALSVTAMTVPPVLANAAPHRYRVWVCKNPRRAANNGTITAKDFADFKPEWVKPIEKHYRGYTLHEIPPNGQGIAALMAVGILANFDLAGLPVDSADSQHLQIEAMKLAFADVYKFVGERSAMAVQAARDSGLSSVCHIQGGLAAWKKAKGPLLH